MYGQLVAMYVTLLDKSHQVIYSVLRAAASNVNTIKGASQLFRPVLLEDVAPQEGGAQGRQPPRLLHLVQLAGCILHCCILQLHTPQAFFMSKGVHLSLQERAQHPKKACHKLHGRSLMA